jgi:lipopolysaccharide export system protein LptA
MRALAAMVFAVVSFAPHAWAQPLDLTKGGAIELTWRDSSEIRDQEKTAIVTGDARAVRGNVTVLADRLVAHYRKKAGGTGEAGTAGNEIYRLEAHGHVRIVTPTDEAVGDAAVYDIDQAVLVMTGAALRLTTPQQTLTARDSLEYWSDKRMAVARGAAVVVTSDGRRISADTLVGYTAPPKSDQPAAAKADPTAASGTLERVEAYGNVEVRTASDTGRADRGLYVAALDSAWLLGNVRLSASNGMQMKVDAAVANKKTGIFRTVNNPGNRAQGMIPPSVGKPPPVATPAPVDKPKP